MLVLSDAEVERLLPVADAVALVEAAFVAYSQGRITCPQRLSLPLLPEGAVLLSMPAFDGALYAGVKLVSVQPANAQRNLPVVRGTYLLFDGVTCEPLALLGATRLTAIRTGAAGGVAAKLLALPNADRLALIGAGAQAVTQLMAALAVRPLRDVWVYSLTPQHVEDFIAREAPRVPVRLHAARSAGEAVRQATIVVTATNAATPVFADEDIQPGTHITAVGAFTAAMQEVPDATVARARVFVDTLDAAWHEAGDLAGPLARGVIGRDHVVGELGALASGEIVGRGSTEQVTFFKSVGLAAQDLMCAAAVYRRALEAGVGTRALL
ncbi:MAG TPA: ornithine cyclodeaminase family protein [Chloroflexota bacterium]|nr:ornithine cyclodeaminase family protein [Chloroflexota bacterium]